MPEPNPIVVGEPVSFEGLDALTYLTHAPLVPGVCILCRKVPPVGEATEEHIFPKWLQNRF